MGCIAFCWEQRPLLGGMTTAPDVRLAVLEQVLEAAVGHVPAQVLRHRHQRQAHDRHRLVRRLADAEQRSRLRRLTWICHWRTTHDLTANTGVGLSKRVGT